MHPYQNFPTPTGFDSPTDIAEYLLRVAEIVGDPVTLPRLHCLLTLVNGHTLALTGQPAFLEPIRQGEGAPEIPSLNAAYGHHIGPIYLSKGERPQLRGSIAIYVHGVLSRYGALSGIQLREFLVGNSLWTVSFRTENILDHRNMMAWFRANTNLESQLSENPVEVEFPVTKVEGFDHAAHSQMLKEMIAEDLAFKEREDQKQVERTLWAIAEAERVAEEMKPKPQTASPISRLVSLFSGNGKGV